MRRLEETFSRLKVKDEAALIAYVTGGDPKPEWTPRIAEALIDGGADIIELGIPFSDPIADGPAIQAADLRALESGTTPKTVLETVRMIKRNFQVPVVILTYYNPIFRMGLEKFFCLARACGVDGVAVPDLPVEEAGECKEKAELNDIDTVFFAAPSTSPDRLRKIIEFTSGFLYLVSVFGITGVREKIQDSTLNLIDRIVPYTSGRIPLALGFGISKPEHVLKVLTHKVDGVIAGSVFVKIVEENRDSLSVMLSKLRNKAFELKDATRARVS